MRPFECTCWQTAGCNFCDLLERKIGLDVPHGECLIIAAVTYHRYKPRTGKSCENECNRFVLEICAGTVWLKILGLL